MTKTQGAIDKWINNIPEHLDIALKLAGINLIGYSFSDMALVFYHEIRGIRWLIDEDHPVEFSVKFMLDDLVRRVNQTP